MYWKEDISLASSKRVTHIDTLAWRCRKCLWALPRAKTYKPCRLWRRLTNSDYEGARDFMLKYDEKQFKSVCIHGDYNKIIAYLESVDDGDELLTRYKDIYENGVYIIETQDERLVDFFRRYEDYLKWAFTNKTTIEECKKYFMKKFQAFFTQNKFLAFFTKPRTWWQMERRVNRFFKGKGYHALFGITNPYPDLYLWSKQTVQTKLVELPEGSVEIEVCEMDGVITGGWADYLSLGKVGTGGWVTKKGTAYFKSAYDDTESDKFQLSLLKHEGQHFYDLKKYPKMKSTDLEYRAKLVELIYYKDMSCFFNFLGGISDDEDRANPHVYANTKIIQALSGKIFEREMENCHDLWMAESGKIPVAALELLKEHSEKMMDWDGRSHII